LFVLKRYNVIRHLDFNFSTFKKLNNKSLLFNNAQLKKIMYMLHYFYRRLYKNLQRKVCAAGAVYLDQSPRRSVYQNEALFPASQSDLVLKFQTYPQDKWGAAQ
jgi:hypothetical protein